MNNIDYWNQKAKKYGKAPEAAINDVWFRKCEIDYINQFIDKTDTVLDVGCGNGWGTKQFKGKVTGIDKSPEMIKVAGKGFKVGDIMDLSEFGVYDVVVCNRVLINLPTEKDQIHALKELKKHCRKYLIITEVTKQGRKRINKFRKNFGLEPIKTHWHNLYVDEKIMRGYRARYDYPTYSLISKVIYPFCLTLKDKEPLFLSPINELAYFLESNKIKGGHQVTFIYD